jgi:hypothetical protein
VTDTLAFDAPLRRRDAHGSSAVITLPFDVKALFGRSRCPVRVTINDHTWRTTTQVYGEDYHIVVNASARSAAGVQPGDHVRVHVRKDDALRSTELPSELACRLRADATAREAYESLPPSHRREYAHWVDEATLPETRVRRAEAALERIKADRRPQSA